ncbi:EAL domain-containing protein [Rheinheimera sp.]|uniref:EAL domain-containing protein n=1 Tax=Rheinheimera sp. TaxID=1869214 RepID=UPI003AF72009
MGLFELLKRKQRWQTRLFIGAALLLNALLAGVAPAMPDRYLPLMLCLNLPFVLVAAWWMWWQPFMREQLHHWQQTEMQTCELLQQLEMDYQDAVPVAAQIQRASLKLRNWQKRDAETRQLVRVQGLVDHELAVGNRLYFESRLQHYLTDSAEPVAGALFLLQISHPEPVLHNTVKLPRLRSCIELLTELCSVWPQVVMARMADNDLALLIPGMQSKEAELFGDRLALVLSQASCFSEVQDFDLIHVGFVLYEQGQSSYQLLSEADMALKTAQLQGPNAAFGFADPQKPKIKGSVWWRTELNNALRDKRFLLSFQPVFSWHDEDVLQHEVLVRLQSSDGDKLSAGVFLPMAANCGLTGAIDQTVLLQVAQVCTRERQSYQGRRCSVNITISSVLDNGWWRWLEEQVQQRRLPVDLMALEFHEHHLHQHYLQLKPRLLELQAWGFALVVDHVGLSLTPAPYSDELPISMLKIHPAVVRHIDQQLEQQLFVRGLLASCSGTDTLVIATAVESESEWHCLKKLGVAGAQGYYFSQPLARLIAQNQLME